MLTLKRIDLQDCFRHLPRNPREDDMKKIEQLRASINAEFFQLEALQHAVCEMSSGLLIIEEKDDAAEFDDLDDINEDPPSNQEPPSIPETMPIDSRTLTIPSTLKDPHPSHCAIELTLRIRQAHHHLSALWGAIADKSFQYSHVLRVAPWASARTRARSGIAKLNDIISFHSRTYTKCRAAMLRLHADDGILSKFRVLSKRDVSCSTAMIQPNIPGSSTLRLSWIWQTGLHADQEQPHALQECMCSAKYIMQSSHTFIVRRVHWLRA
jgi:hypothetical protein